MSETTRKLNQAGKDAAADFASHYEDRGCSCFINPPCGFCTHEGNPSNMEETPEFWEEIGNELSAPLPVESPEHHQTIEQLIAQMDTQADMAKRHTMEQIRLRDLIDNRLNPLGYRLTKK